MAELASARDLKSRVPLGTYGFESRFGHSVRFATMWPAGPRSLLHMSWAFEKLQEEGWGRGDLKARGRNHEGHEEHEESPQRTQRVPRRAEEISTDVFSEST